MAKKVGKTVKLASGFSLRAFLKENLLIILIVLVALFIRYLGVYPGYPQFHPDEGTSYHSAVYLLYHWLNPGRFDYPAGMPLIHAFIYVILFIPIMVLKILANDPSSILELAIRPTQFFTDYKDAIFGKVEINALYWSRYITATFGAATVGLLYITAKRLFNREAGIFAAFFLVFNYRHVLGSHFGLPDVLGSFFALLTLFAPLLLFEKNTKRRYIFAGIIAGIYFSLKYQPFALAPFFIVHLLWAIRKRSFWYLFHFPFLLGLFIAIFVFLLINPYYLANFGNAMYQNSIDYKRYQMGVLRFRAYPLFYLFHWGIGNLPFISILLGIFAMLFRNPIRFLLPFSFVGLYMFFMVLYSNGGIYSRNFVQVMPFLMVFAGYFMYRIYVLLRKFLIRRVSLIIMSLLLIVINFDSAKNSFILGLEYSRPWTTTTLSKWLEEKIPENVTIREYPLFIPPHAVTTLQEKKVKRLSWSYDKGPNDLSEFQKEGTDFAILNAYNYQSIIYTWREFPKPEMYLKIDDIPFDYIDNSFYGASIRELMQYTVFEAYKPWQAQETSNFLVFKIPPKPTEIGNKIKDFTFSAEGEVWKLRGNFGFDSVVSEWDKDEGKKENGAMKMTKNDGILISSRLASPPIPIKSGKLYTVRGWIKNSTPKWTYYKTNDGFVRMDFYKNDSKEELDKLGVGVALSDRAEVTKDGNWIEVQAGIVAPKDTNYLTISFQLNEGNYYSLYLDDVELYEIDQIPNESFKEIPYIKSTIPKESLYFNSFL